MNLCHVNTETPRLDRDQPLVSSYLMTMNYPRERNINPLGQTGVCPIGSFDLHGVSPKLLVTLPIRWHGTAWDCICGYHHDTLDAAILQLAKVGSEPLLVTLL